VEVSTCAGGHNLSYLLFANDSSLPSVSFLFLGWGLCTKVHSWRWNWQRTQLGWPSWMTHLLFLLLHASHGRSLRARVFGADSVDAVLPVLAERMLLLLLRESLPSLMSTEGGGGLREAMAMGAVRAMPVGFDILNISSSVPIIIIFLAAEARLEG
jgi:hypothetical protein